MSIPPKAEADAHPAPRRYPRRTEPQEVTLSPRRLQQIENATVVMATALGGVAVFYAFFQYTS